MFGLVALNLLTGFGVKRCSDRLWLHKCDGTFEDNFHRERQQEQSCYTWLHHWKGCGKPKCRPFLSSSLCSVHVVSGFSIVKCHGMAVVLALAAFHDCIAFAQSMSCQKKPLWEHICFWLSALIFWRKCLKVFTVFFSKFGCCLKSFLQNVSDGNILRKCLSSSFHTSHMVSARYLFCLTVVVNYYLCISFCVASRLWHEKHFSMGGRVSGLLRISGGGTEEGFVMTKLRLAFDWLLWGHLWESSQRDSFLGG